MNLRELALRLLCEWEMEGKYINLAISSHLTDSLSQSERAQLTALLYTTVEKKITYDYYICALAKRSIDDISPKVLNILRLGVCQILDMRSVPDFAAVNESVKLAGNAGERSFINAVLRSVVRRKESGDLPMPPYEKNRARYYSVKYSFPLWIVKKFISDYGEQSAVSLFEAFNKEEPLDVTVNTLKISREAFLSELTKRGYEAEASKLSPISVKIYSKLNPTELYGYSEGYFFVQDEASAISALALSAEKNETLVDVCASPGGKSFAAAVLMGDSGKIYSYDLYESKLSLIKSGAERLGFKSIQCAARDAREPNEELLFSADKLICDVVCSGLGVISKKSDLRYRGADGLSELPKIQLEILASSVKYLKAGGVLVYSTCTLNKAENEDVVTAFLKENSDFSLEDFTVGELKSEGGMLTLYPQIHETDGFFIAKLRKNK